MTHITNSISHDSYHELNESYSHHTISWHAILDSVAMTHITNSTSHVFSRVRDMTHSYVWQDSYHELPTHCNTLQHIAAHCSTLQHTATHCSNCNTLQHTATHCNTLQHTATHCSTLQHTAAHCSTLQHTATHCNTLQHTAIHCNTLQHTATCRTCQGAMSHIPFSYVTHTSRIHVTHLNESCLRRVHRRATFSQSATSHISAQWKHHVSAQFSESRLCTVEESCHTSQRVILPQSLSAGDMVPVSNYLDMTQVANSTSHVSAESIGGRHGHSQQLSWHDSNHELNESCLQSRMWYDSFICVTWLISQTQRVMSPQSLSAGDMVTVSNYRDMTQITNSTSHVSAESIGGRHGHSQQRPRRCMQKGECAPHRPYQQVKALNTWIDPKTRKDLNTWKQTSKHEKRPLNLQRRVCPTLSVSAGKSP